MAVPRSILRLPDETDATPSFAWRESMTAPRIALRNYADFENALEQEARLFEALYLDVRVKMVSAGIYVRDTTIAEGGQA